MIESLALDDSVEEAIGFSGSMSNMFKSMLVVIIQF
jgi:hypothetical protein